MEQRYDCIVIGAGFAGLSAAKRLEEKGLSVLVLEARDRVGGRTELKRLAGRQIDVGGMWLGPTQTALADLVESYGVDTYPTHLEGQCRGKVGGLVFQADGEAFENGIGLISKVRLGLLVSKLDAMSERINPAAPWKSEKAALYDAQTVASWAARHVGDRRVRRLLDFVVRSVFCAEPDELSLLFFLFYLKSAGGFEVLIQAGPGGAQNLLLEGGLGAIAQKLRDELKNPVRIREPVLAIAQTETEATAHTGLATYSANRIVVAIPPALVEHIDFSPELPSGRQALLKRQVMGSCIKVWIAYETPFWRADGRNGAIFDETRPFSPVFDATPPNAKNGFLAGFFDARHGAEWSDKTPEDRRHEVMRTLVEHLGPEAAKPIDFVERDWIRERWSSGCYGAFMPPGALSAYGPWLRRPHGRVFWAGTEMATKWSGYVDGAIRSGHHAADQVIEANDRASAEKATAAE